MRYYQLRLDSNPGVIGVKHGEAQAEIVEDKFLDKSYYDYYINFAFPQVSREESWRSYGTLPKQDINLEYVELRADAIATDFLSYADHLRGGGEFILSKRAADIVTQFTLPTYKLYSVNLFRNRHKFDGYKLFYCPTLGYDVIDFNKTVFFRGSPILGKRKFSLSSKEDFIAEKIKSPLFQCDYLAFSDKFEKSLDLFNVTLSTDMYVSERLAWAIEEANLTGINIMKPQNPVLAFDSLDCS